mgnify:CR=1 FL=1|jgi:hypothetical protein|tara:strand:+ start:300 stop:527 length:228 start_codon:yes stop_codon:yes gene_type:complete
METTTEKTKKVRNTLKGEKMKKYNVSIIETINYSLVVNAESDKKAEDIAFEKMTEGDGFLDKEFIVNVDIIKEKK